MRVMSHNCLHKMDKIEGAVSNVHFLQMSNLPQGPHNIHITKSLWKFHK